MKPFARINLSFVLSSVALAKVDALRRGILVSSLAFAAGCMNAGYNYAVSAVKATGEIPRSVEEIGIVDPESYGFLEMSAWGTVRELTKQCSQDSVPVTSIKVNRSKEVVDVPLWSRILCLATLSILPYYATVKEHFEMEIGFPDGTLEFAIEVKGHGLCSLWPTGFLPIPGFYEHRYWDGLLGDGGLHRFGNIAVGNATREVLIGHLPAERSNP